MTEEKRVWASREEDFIDTVVSLENTMGEAGIVDGAEAEVLVHRVHALCMQALMRDMLREEIELIVQAAKDDANDAVWEYLRSDEGREVIRKELNREPKK